jgi:hypothetical protein
MEVSQLGCGVASDALDCSADLSILRAPCLADDGTQYLLLLTVPRAG